jgi:hypothetical protein
MDIYDLCICEEEGKDGTKQHSGGLTPIVATEEPAVRGFSCDNHLSNFLEAGLRKGYVN